MKYELKTIKLYDRWFVRLKDRKTKPFDIAEHLSTPEDIRDFLEEVANTGDDSDLIHALGTAARAVGMTEIAQKAGVTRASLYKSLSGNGNPSYSTISRVAKALGCRLNVVQG